MILLLKLSTVSVKALSDLLSLLVSLLVLSLMTGPRLQEKVAIVTGGGGGLGKGISKKFVDEGAKVIIADFNEELGNSTAKELGCDFVKTDVTKKEQWDSLLKQVDKKYGRLDCVVNNAGTSYKNKVRDY